MRRLEISRRLLARWRAEYRAGALGGGRRPAFAPVAVVEEPTPATPTASESEKLEIVPANGRRLVVAASIDPAVLVRLLPVLEGA